MQDFWNYVDILFLVANFTFLVLDLILQGELKLSLRIISAIASIMCCFKVLSYSRGFSKTAFISNMLIIVF